MIVGKSKATPFKQKDFSLILSHHLKITQAILNKHKDKPWCDSTYWYYDINAGDASEVLTSPIIFINEISRSSLLYQFNCLMIEKNKEVYNKLDENITEFIHDCLPLNLQRPLYKNIYIEKGDHNKILESESKISDNRVRYGLLYHDPNGRPSFPPQEQTLTRFAKRFPQIDILINFNARSIKGPFYSSHTNHKKLNKRVSDYIKEFPKKYWIIRDTIPNDAWQWTQFFGTNWDAFPKFKQYNFWRLDSKQGEKIIHKLDYKKEKIE